jgi:predicted kinase
MKKLLIMLVGLPGSGKSTWAKDVIHNAVTVSTDNIREQLYGNANIQGKWKAIEAEADRQIKNAFNDNNINIIIYDATNLRMDRRKAFLKKWSKYDCIKEAVIFWAFGDFCKKRNKMRDRQVPESVIDRMEEEFEEPTYKEGWDTIFYMTWNDDIKDYEITLQNKH